ncbi:PseG/SpsG family protein [Nonomuraea pusilla]|uniref:Spore coat polysaccharide biosynthesis protein SpsG, predicted glycosyltransferase n=1 Tax=Nonomuraea pusilla TaxID=46177 RepID=A0A1H7VHD4_9ACTN|nr:hypothetical protein [Nonomuraea pusilla]SEM08550.1 Spore coat polysaccharide biosynthesis protein SpsG, predicted glycosyltransferase [Nonomuraea pusilla]
MEGAVVGARAGAGGDAAAGARVGVRCDVTARGGAGHLVRCVALAEELTGRGVEVLFLGDLSGSAWACAQLTARGLPLLAAPHDPAGLARLAVELRLGAMVLDSYELPPGTGAALRAAGVPVLAIVDGDPLGQSADLYLDQNLDAELTPWPHGGERLAGLRYVLLRDAVLRLGGRARPDAAVSRPARAAVPRPAATAGPAGGLRCRGVAGSGELAGGSRSCAGVARVLCFFGGTDSAGVAPRWAEALRRTGVPFQATVVSPEPFDAPDDVAVVPPTDRLPELMTEADLVVTAAGSAVWELLHLGVPAALTWVAPNQLIGYRALVGRGAAAGLGREPGEAAVGALTRLLADPAARDDLARRGSGLVDGRGRERVADALLALL